MSYFVDRTDINKGFDPFHSPNEIVPDRDTPMYRLGEGYIGTLGQIWERAKWANVDLARKEADEERPGRERQWEARKEREAADNAAAQDIAYAEYEEREGRPHPLFAGATATAETVEPPALPAQNPQDQVPVMASEAALAR
jgi:hypothetical protein